MKKHNIQKELEYIRRRLEIIYDAVIANKRADRFIAETFINDWKYIQEHNYDDLEYLQRQEERLYEYFVLIDMPQLLKEAVHQRLREAGVYDRPWYKPKKQKVVNQKVQKELEYIRKRLEIIYDAVISHAGANQNIVEGLVKDRKYFQKNHYDDLKYLQHQEKGIYEYDLLVEMPLSLQEEVHQKLREAGVYDRPWRKPKKLEGAKLTEADFIKKKHELYAQYMANNFQHQISSQRSLKIVQYLYSMGDLRGLRSMHTELHGYIREAVYPEDKIQLEILFEKHLGEKRGSYDMRWEKKVQALIEKRSINNIKEYTLAHNWVEANYQDDTKLQLIKELNLLLADFDRRDVERRQQTKKLI